MNQSEQIDQLSAALALAQGAIKNPARNKTAVVRTRSGQDYKFDYADLNACTDAGKKPLADNGLAITQEAEQFNGAWQCRTTLGHTSGQWRATTYPIIITLPRDRDGNELPMSSQSFASAFTYAKRNAYCALLCIAAGDDDDANLADGNTAAINEKSAKEKYGTTAKDVIEHETVYDHDGKPVDNIGLGSLGIKRMSKTMARPLYARLLDEIRGKKTLKELYEWEEKQTTRDSVASLANEFETILRSEFTSKQIELGWKRPDEESGD
jgi:hypothetical protein